MSICGYAMFTFDYMYTSVVYPTLSCGGYTSLATFSLFWLFKTAVITYHYLPFIRLPNLSRGVTFHCLYQLYCLVLVALVPCHCLH